MPIKIGDEVRAAEEIIEDDFNGEEVFVHSPFGGLGIVREIGDVDEGWALVTWQHRGTTVAVDVDQLVIRPVASNAKPGTTAAC